MQNEKYQKLSEEFDAEYNEDPFKKAEKSLAILDEKKYELAEASKGEITLQDQKYMQTELYSLLANTTDVMEILKSDLKQGSRPSAYEAYAKLVNSAKDLISELRELNKVIVDINIKQDIPESVNNVVIMTGPEMLDEILKAKEKSEINAVDAKFDILAEDEDDTKKGH